MILQKLNLDTRLEKLVKRDVKIPAYLDDFNRVDDYWYPHPPCLIPVFLGHGAAYKGVINHFFCDRENSYVEYNLEHGFISETARTFDQFLTSIVLKMIIIEDDLTPSIIDFCKSLNYNEYKAVDQFALDYGDDPQEFKYLVFFDTQMPFKYLDSMTTYDGDYPSSLTILNTAGKLHYASAYEIAVPEKLLDVKQLPSWLLSSNDREKQFYDYLADDKLMEAWFTLNAKGWRSENVAKGLQILAEKANDELLNLVADNWIDGWKKSVKNK